MSPTTVGNPKAILFFLALLRSVVDLGRLTPLAFDALAATVVAIVCGVFGACALLAIRARRLFTSPRAMRLVNRGSGHRRGERRDSDCRALKCSRHKARRISA